jgi:uncharacterized protein YbaP (TraB family)
MNIPKVRPSWVLCLVLVLGKSAVVAAPATSSSGKHPLWKVSSPTNSIYLLGSIHVLRKTDYPLPDVIESAFSNAPVAAFEADINEMQDPAVAIQMLTKCMLPEGETLADRLSPELYKAFTNKVSEVSKSLTNQASESAMALMMIDRFTPGMAATTLATVQLDKLHLDPKYGLDKQLYDRAKKDGKKTLALETVEFQLNLFTQLSKEEGEVFLKTTLTDMDKLEAELPEFIQAWKNGDPVQLEKLLDEATEQAPGLYKRLISDRNARWIPKIEDMLKQNNNSIVVVGTGHLVGKDNVVQLLAKKGYKVTQL